MEIRRMKLDDLHFADYNPRVQLQPDDPEYKALKTSITTDGVVVPIIWNEETGNVVGGHQRLRLLLDMGYTDADVSVVHMDAKQEKQANIALNRVEGTWDEQKLQELLSELETEDILSTGFTEQDLHIIFPDGADDERQIAESISEIANSEDPENEVFTVFLTFPSRQEAEDWASNEGIETNFGSKRTMTIRMEGQSYAD